MTMPPFSTDPLENLSQRIDYLQGRWMLTARDLRGVGSHTRALSANVGRVCGVGVLDKNRAPEARPAPTVTKDDAEGRLTHMLPRTSDLIAGLHGRTGLVFQLGHDSNGLDVRLGVWSSADQSADIPRRREMLTSLLGSCYTRVMWAAPDPKGENNSGYGDIADGSGYVVGIPDPAPSRPDDAATPIDRLVRALPEGRWSATIIALPIAAAGTIAMRDGLLNEARLIHAATNTANARVDTNPAARGYLDTLESTLRTVNRAATVGAWRTAVYLRGDSATYRTLAAVWTGIFSGPHSAPLPVRVIDDPAVGEFAQWMSMPDIPGDPSPTPFRYPFAAQTVLTSYQLAAYLHLPEQEHAGYVVEQVPAFDTWTPPPRPASLDLGRVVSRGNITSGVYSIQADALTKHAFVSGVTGSGKTNTVVALLLAAQSRGTGFLVLEPAKTEYRSLLDDPRLGRNLAVFTAGDETISPLRINPFEVPAGTAVATHLDLVRALFAVSFALWSPLPQILERALHQAYADRGWDVTNDVNERDAAATSSPEAYPTLRDVHTNVEAIIAGSGYDPEAIARIRGALSTKLSGLSVGGKGRMFETIQPTPPATLFDGPAVIEMESLGDEEDKAFLMGLLLIRLVEHRRAQGRSDTLRHLLVVEEAHRLLSAKSTNTDKDFGGAGTKAVSAFTDLLAEVRAYGQGLIIADQVPSRLAPEVVKNSGLKVVHRLVAEDDRKAMGTSTAMNDMQIRSLATLSPAGRAAVFAEGDDAPVLIQVLDVKAGMAPISDSDLRERLGSSGRPGPGCCGASSTRTCDRAAVAAADPSVRSRVSQIAVTVATSPGTASRMSEDLELMASNWFPTTDRSGSARDAWKCLAWRSSRNLARRRGAQRGWTYRQEALFADALLSLLLSMQTRDAARIRDASNAFAAVSVGLFRREIDPFPRCADICPDRTCLFRLPLEDALLATTTAQRVQAAIGTEGLRPATWELADQVTMNPPSAWSPAQADAASEARWRAALCAAQLAFAKFTPPGYSPRAGLEILLATELPDVDEPEFEDKEA